MKALEITIAITVVLVFAVFLTMVLFKRDRDCDHDHDHDYERYQLDPRESVLYEGGADKQFVDLYCVCECYDVV